MLIRNFLAFEVFALIILTAVIIVGCGESSPSDSDTDGNNTDKIPPNTVIIEDFTFKPATLTIATGTTVKWTNRDSDIHTVVSDNNFKSENLNKEESYNYKFDNEGTYNYYCGIHPSMKGKVNVFSESEY